MKMFADPFEYDDFDDAADIVMATDMDINATIEKAAEDEDDKDLEPEELVSKLQEAGVISYFTENESDYEHSEYHEEDDDAINPVDVDAQDYCESDDEAESDDMDEDELIDAVAAEDVDSIIDLEEDELDEAGLLEDIKEFECKEDNCGDDDLDTDHSEEDIDECGGKCSKNECDDMDDYDTDDDVEECGSGCSKKECKECDDAIDDVDEFALFDDLVSESTEEAEPSNLVSDEIEAIIKDIESFTDDDRF